MMTIWKRPSNLNVICMHCHEMTPGLHRHDCTPCLHSHNCSNSRHRPACMIYACGVLRLAYGYCHYNLVNNSIDSKYQIICI